MNFLNLSLGELLGLAGVISAGLVALYLLDRSKRRQVVSTLRFWTPADVRTEWKRQRRIQQPWSLVLQIVSVILLLTALAGPRWGAFTDTARDHVLILDTSAWMGARAPRGGILLDQAKGAAIAYVNAMPSSDRLMLVRADALATPATTFESNHGAIIAAIRESQPGASALNLDQALEFAQRAQRLQSQRTGEIVYAGAGRVPKTDAERINSPKNLRVLPVTVVPENVGLRKIGVRRPTSSPDAWDAYVVVRNDGTKPRLVNLELQFGGSPAGAKALTLGPGAESQASFTFHSKAGGFLEARIRTQGGDAFPQDDRAVMELPAQKSLRVAVYSDQPELLRPLMEGNSQVEAVLLPPAKYDPKEKADVFVFDRFAPPAAPQAADSIWIEPPDKGSPFTVKATVANKTLERWRPESALGTGLYTKDAQLASTKVFAPAQGDIPVAEIADGPVIVARPAAGNQGSPKMVALGFHPLRSSLKYELATPLLMANILRWLAPDTFRHADVQAGTVGTVSVPLYKGAETESIKVLGENNVPLPFTISNNTLQFFAGAPGSVRLVMDDRETVYSLSLPDVADTNWKIPAGARRGIPKASVAATAAADIWPWLAIAGFAGLLLDWLLFGRSQLFRLRPSAAAGSASELPWRKAS